MVRKPSNNPAPSGSMHSSLESLLPIDATSFKRPSSLLLIWSTLLLVWLISLLPWRLWQPAPDLLLLMIAFWSLNEPHRVSMLTAFVFGLLMDVQDAGLLGEHALTYTLVAYGAVSLTRRLQRFSPLVQAIHMLPIFITAEAISRFRYLFVVSNSFAFWTRIKSSLWEMVMPVFRLYTRRK